VGRKVEKIKLPKHRFSSIFHETYIIIDKESDRKKKSGVIKHLRELNPCIDIKMPTSTIYLYISSMARALNA